MIIIITYSEEAVSINKALEDAGKGQVQTYLALTDVLIGIIKCCPACIAKTMEETEALKRVFVIILLSHSSLVHFYSYKIMTHHQYCNIACYYRLKNA